VQIVPQIFKKCHPEFTKTRHYETKNTISFLGRGLDRLFFPQNSCQISPVYAAKHFALCGWRINNVSVRRACVLDRPVG